MKKIAVALLALLLLAGCASGKDNATVADSIPAGFDGTVDIYFVSA